MNELKIKFIDSWMNKFIDSFMNNSIIIVYFWAVHRLDIKNAVRRQFRPGSSMFIVFVSLLRVETISTEKGTYKM